MPVEAARLDIVLGGSLDPSFTGAFNNAESKLINFSRLSESLEKLKPFSPFIVQGIQAAKSVGQLSDALVQLKIEQAAATNPAELIAYNNAIKAVTTEIKAAGSAGTSSFGGIGKSLTGALSSVRQLAYILPGIGIAGIFNLAFEAISSVADELDLFGTKVTASAQAVKDFNAEMAKGGADLNTEETKLSALVQVARDHGESLNVRTNAIKELQKEYPGYLSNINLENINSQEAANAIALLTDALQRKALVQAYSNLLTKAEEELLAKQQSGFADNVTILDELIASFKTAGNVNSTFVGTLVTKGEKNKATALTDLQKVVDNYSHALSDAIQEQAKFNDFQLLNPTKAKAAPKAVDEFITPRIKIFRGDTLSTVITDQLQDAMGVVQRNLNKNPLTVTVNTGNTTNALDDIMKKYSQLVQTVQGLTDAMGQTFVLLVTGGKNAFKSLEGAIISLITKLVSAVIEAALLAAIFSALGFSAGSTGGFSGILKSILGIANLTKHAEGGIFMKPTQWGNNLIGEKGPEALVPLDRLSSMMQGANNIQRVEVVGRISGNDIVLIQNRQNLRNNRNYGNNFKG